MAELERLRPVTEYQQTPGGFVKVAEMHPDQEAGRYVHISDLREALTSERAVWRLTKNRMSLRRGGMLGDWRRDHQEELNQEFREAGYDLQALAKELLGGDDG